MYSMLNLGQKAKTSSLYIMKLGKFMLQNIFPTLKKNGNIRYPNDALFSYFIFSERWFLWKAVTLL